MELSYSAKKEVIPGEKPLEINWENLISHLAGIRTHDHRICTTGALRSFKVRKVMVK